MLYIGLERYTEETLKEVIASEFDGVILGDILCMKRMFPYSGNELMEYMTRLKANDKKIILQTPMYATDRKFASVIDIVSYCVDKGLSHSVIVQDIGVASAIKNSHPSVELIWGKMGYARTPIINTETIKWYKEIGINAVECKNIGECEYTGKIGLVPYLMIGVPSYKTINRECYYKYEHEIFDDNCCCGCLQREKIVIPAKKPIETTLDGYVLGWEYNYNFEYTTANVDNIIIYARNYEQAHKNFIHMKGEMV